MAFTLTPQNAAAGMLYLTGEESLRVRSFGSLASTVLAIEGRMLDMDGTVHTIAETHTPASDRTAVTSLHALSEGFLAGFSVRATGAAPRRGQVFVVVELVRGRFGAIQPLGVLFQGYVQDTTYRGWPGSPLESSVDGPGVLRSIAGTDPAPGVEVSETVPTNARWRLFSFRVTFITSAAVANRQPVITIDDGTTILWQAPALTVLAASSTASLQASQTSPDVTSTALIQRVTLPHGLLMQGGWRIRTVTASLDVADNYATPQLCVEEWIED